MTTTWEELEDIARAAGYELVWEPYGHMRHFGQVRLWRASHDGIFQDCPLEYRCKQALSLIEQANRCRA
jgi:hypothetical protein